MVYLAAKWDAFNSTEDNTGKKIIQHYFKLKKRHAWKIYELCVENVRKKRHSTS